MHRSRRARLPTGWRNAIQLWEIAFAAPQVIAYRMAKLGNAGGVSSVRDQRERHRMVQEKVDAWGESVAAMTIVMWQANLAAGLQLMRQWSVASVDPWFALTRRSL